MTDDNMNFLRQIHKILLKIDEPNILDDNGIMISLFFGFPFNVCKK
jgi:hypothetical protein